MDTFVKTFFTLILTTSVVFGSVVTFTPVFAEDADNPGDTTEETSDTPTNDPSTIIEEPSTGGNEWDGVITDPVITPTEEPAPTEPTESTTLVVTEVVTTVTPPATTSTSNKTAQTTKTTSNTTQAASTTSPSETSTTEEVTTKSAQSESSGASKDSYTSESSTDSHLDSEKVEVPNTATFELTFDEATRKILLLSLISTAIVYFSAIEIWGIMRLIKITKNEKLLRAAKEKVTEVKQAKISRTAD